MEIQTRNLKHIPANQVKEGDVLAFKDGRMDVTIEEVTARDDGRVGLHANDDTWTSFYDGGEIVSIVEQKGASLVLRSDAIFAEVGGEYGVLWAQVCEAENQLAHKLLDNGPSLIVVMDGDGWYLAVDGNELVLTHVNAKGPFGPYEDPSTRFDFSLEWIDASEEDLRVYVDTVLRAVESFDSLIVRNRESRTLVVGAHATQTSGSQPEYCVIDSGPVFMRRLQHLHELCTANNLSEVRCSDGPLMWGPAGIEEEVGLSNSELVVTADGRFWFTDIPKHGTYLFESDDLDISSIAEQLKEETSDFVFLTDDLQWLYESDHEVDEQ